MEPVGCDAEERIRLLEDANRVLCQEMPKVPLVTIGHIWLEEDGKSIRFVIIEPNGDREREREAMGQFCRIVAEYWAPKER